MPQKSGLQFKITDLKKGQLRKLNALKKSLGEEIALRAFAEWFAKLASNPSPSSDKNAELIAKALEPFAKRKKLQIPRGGYLVTRGRGRVIVERAKSKSPTKR